MRFNIDWTVRLWHWITSWFRRAPKPLHTVHLEELPEQLGAGAVYVLGEGSHKWFVAMICPCGCGETVQVSLLTEARPRWRLVEHSDGTISLEPSVWRKVGCRSHFFLRRGMIQWCGNAHTSGTFSVG
jgi:hypothetical protein